MQADVQAATASTLDPPLARLLARLAEAAELLGVPDVGDLAAATTRRLRALRLEAAVVGEFKHGKSSLINALVGRAVLPVGVLPLTAVPTVLERAADLLQDVTVGLQREPRRAWRPGRWSEPTSGPPRR